VHQLIHAFELLLQILVFALEVGDEGAFGGAGEDFLLGFGDDVGGAVGGVLVGPFEEVFDELVAFFHFSFQEFESDKDFTVLVFVGVCLDFGLESLVVEIFFIKNNLSRYLSSFRLNAKRSRPNLRISPSKRLFLLFICFRRMQILFIQQIFNMRRLRSPWILFMMNIRVLILLSLKVIRLSLVCNLLRIVLLDALINVVLVHFIY